MYSYFSVATGKQTYYITKTHYPLFIAVDDVFQYQIPTNTQVFKCQNRKNNANTKNYIKVNVTRTVRETSSKSAKLSKYYAYCILVAYKTGDKC